MRACCRHFKVALKHDPKIAFPASLSSHLDSMMQRISLEDVWHHGALWEPLAMESAVTAGQPVGAAMAGDLALGDEAFQRAVSIVLPLKAFFRGLTEACCDWVRCAHTGMETCAGRTRGWLPRCRRECITSALMQVIRAGVQVLDALCEVRSAQSPATSECSPSRVPQLRLHDHA